MNKILNIVKKLKGEDVALDQEEFDVVEFNFKNGNLVQKFDISKKDFDYIKIKKYTFLCSNV